MQHRLNRRGVMALVGGALAWPLGASAQQAGKSLIVGFLGQSTPLGESERAAAFAQRLRELVTRTTGTVERTVAAPAEQARAFQPNAAARSGQPPEAKNLVQPATN